MKKLSIIAVAIVVFVAGLGFVGFGQVKSKSTDEDIQRWKDLSLRTRQLYSNNSSDNPEWIRSYGGGIARGYIQKLFSHISLTSDGRFLITAQRKSFYSDRDEGIFALILSKFGEIEFQNMFWFYDTSASYGIYGLQTTSDGGFVITGEHTNFTFPYTEGFLLRLSPAGEALWVKSYGGAHGDRLDSVYQTADGGFILAGLTTDDDAIVDPDIGFGVDLWILKVSSQGDIEWQRMCGGIKWESDWLGSSQQVSVVEGSDGGFYFLADTPSFSPQWSDIWVVKFSSSGILEWQRAYGGKETELLLRGGLQAQPTPDGGVIFSSTTLSFGSSSTSVWIVKLSRFGDIGWQRIYDAEKGDVSTSISPTTDGGYVISGYTVSGAIADASPDCLLFKITDQGELEWNHTYGWDGDQRAYNAKQVEDGGFVIVGSTGVEGSALEDILVCKTGLNGNLEFGADVSGHLDLTVSDTNAVPQDTDGLVLESKFGMVSLQPTAREVDATSTLYYWNLNQPPVNVTVQEVANESLYSSEVYNTIQWEQNPDNSSFSIEKYILYWKMGRAQDYQVLAELDANVLEYLHGPFQETEGGIEYALSSVDSNGNISPMSKAVVK